MPSGCAPRRELPGRDNAAEERMIAPYIHPVAAATDSGVLLGFPHFFYRADERTRREGANILPPPR